MLILLFINLLILALIIWNVCAWPTLPTAKGNTVPESCSILIPARNEEKNLESCLDSAIRQGSIVREIIVCDDHSEDATSKIVCDYSRLDPRIRLIAAGKLPNAWCGKNFVCTLLAAEARGDWLMFLDADARLASDAALRMMAEALRRGAGFLSCWPGLILGGFWEKTLMPMLNFVVFTLFPAPLSLQRNDPSLGLAHGACILVRRADYEATGGHHVVFNKIFEDTCLARAWRASGRSGVCLDGQDVVRVRMYESLAGIWQGFQKNFFPAFNKPITFWLFLVFHTSCFFLPFVLLPLLAIGYTHLWPAGAAALCVLLMRGVQAWRFHYPIWSILFHPLAELILIALGLRSWWQCRFGRGVEWKGRVYERSGHGK